MLLIVYDRHMSRAEGTGPERTVRPLSVDNIAAAARCVDPAFLHSPQVVDTSMTRRIGGELILKLEIFNPVRSFKGRGADFFISSAGQDAQVVCASAGNFGQAIAYAARGRGIPATVFCADGANPVKVARIRDLGAEVRLGGADFDAAKDAARAYAAGGAGRIFVEDGHEPRICEGAGTIAVELAPLQPDVIFVPVGNGALISGIGCWMKARSPATRIIGVSAAGAPAMFESWRLGRLITTPDAATIADGVAVRVPVPAALAWMSELVDDMVLVDDAQLREAQRIARDTIGLILEPSGALGIAAALYHPVPDQLAATVVTGSNFSAADLTALTAGQPG
jgi:threonine dehydratase